MCQTFFEIFKFFYGLGGVWGFDVGGFLVNLMLRFETFIKKSNAVFYVFIRLNRYDLSTNLF